MKRVIASIVLVVGAPWSTHAIVMHNIHNGGPETLFNFLLGCIACVTFAMTVCIPVLLCEIWGIKP